MDKKSILVFGGGELQKSLIIQCKKNNLNTIVVDPNPDAVCKNLADIFEVVNANDFHETCKVVDKHKIEAIITSSTDKPLKMMSVVARKYGFPFISESTASFATNKWLMKDVFLKAGILCAKGYEFSAISHLKEFPVVVKPVDSSGSRGVRICESKEDALKALQEINIFSKHQYAIAEEFISGHEFSVEALHFNGESHVVQITEKTVTPFPHFVETSHMQPASLDDSVKEEIMKLTSKIASVFGFENCASHNEFKVNKNGIYAIEVSPRLGGDRISSHLVPLSTGINMEQCLIEIALGQIPKIKKKNNHAAGIFFFIFDDEFFPEVHVNNIEGLDNIEEVFVPFHAGQKVPEIKSSHDRYGYFIIEEENREELIKYKNYVLDLLFKN